MYLDIAFNLHSNETLTFRKNVNKYINMRKWMVEFLRKLKSRDIKIARLNSVRLTKSISLL